LNPEVTEINFENSSSGEPLSLEDFFGEKCILYRFPPNSRVSDNQKSTVGDVGWWELPEDRARTANFLVIIDGKYISGVRRILGWRNSSTRIGRIQCLSEPTDNLEGVIGKDVSGIYNPRDKTILRFVNC
jgi:hypothetical protein